MTRLTDLLGGVTPPGTGGAAVDRGRIRRRVAHRRRMRRATPLAAGGCALALGGTLAVSMMSQPAASDPVESSPFPSVIAPSVEEDGFEAWWGTCASRPLWTYESGPTENLDLTIELADAGPRDPSVETWATVTLTALTDADSLISGPDIAVLYDKQIIASAKTSDILQLHSMSADETIVTSLAVPLTRCTDGAPLPPGTYEVISSQRYSDELGASPASETNERYPPRVTSAPVELVIEGEPDDDPFGLETGVISPDGTMGIIQPEIPGNTLDQDTGEALLRAQPAGPWDMAIGTSRWIIDSEIPWVQEAFLYNRYNPCAFPDGSVTFPEASYTSDILTVSLDVPDEIGVRYGWVVVGDPLVHYEIHNTSEWYVGGGYSIAYPQLYLARGGELVATARLTPTSGWSYDPWQATDGLPRLPTAAEYYGLYEPGAVDREPLLWREVSSCGSGGPRIDLSPGTYSLLTSTVMSTPNDPYNGPIEFAHLWTSHGTIELTND